MHGSFSISETVKRHAEGQGLTGVQVTVTSSNSAQKIEVVGHRGDERIYVKAPTIAGIQGELKARLRR